MHQLYKGERNFKPYIKISGSVFYMSDSLVHSKKQQLFYLNGKAHSHYRDQVHLYTDIKACSLCQQRFIMRTTTHAVDTMRQSNKSLF